VKRALLLLLALPISVQAQYDGPAVETCRAYAERDLRLVNERVKTIVFERDRALNIERYTRRAGSQFVSSLLYGNGAIVYRSGLALEMSFVCLLADEKRAVFFYWSPRADASALAQCRRGGEGDAAACLDALLQVGEQELTQLYARHYVEAREADAKAGNEERSKTFRRSAEAWRQYRDAQCALHPQGDERKACIVDLTRRRAWDLR